MVSVRFVLVALGFFTDPISDAVEGSLTRSCRTIIGVPGVGATSILEECMRIAGALWLRCLGSHSSTKIGAPSSSYSPENDSGTEEPAFWPSGKYAFFSLGLCFCFEREEAAAWERDAEEEEGFRAVDVEAERRSPG